MRTDFLGIAAAVLTASPVFAADFPVPRYSEGPTYQREVHIYEREYREPAPRVVVAPPAPVVTEVVPAPVFVRRPVVVVRPPVMVDHPVYSPQIHAHSYPVRRLGPSEYHRPLYDW